MRVKKILPVCFIILVCISALVFFNNTPEESELPMPCTISEVYYDSKTGMWELEEDPYCSEQNTTVKRVYKDQHWTQDDADFRLSVNLLKHGFTEKQKNIIISPFSIYLITLLSANGAEGETLTELQENILSDLKYIDREDVNQRTEEYLNNLSPEVEINSSVWGGKFRYNYKKAVKPMTDIEPRPMNTREFNRWISEKTHNRIHNLFSDQTTEKNEFYIVNTASFKEQWNYAFKKKDTKELPFYSLESEKPDMVPMMTAEQEILYAETEKMQAIMLYYQNGDFMQIFLPKPNIDYKKFIIELQTDDLDIAPANRRFGDLKNIENSEDTKTQLRYKLTSVRLYLPRFEIDNTFDKHIFESLNVSKIFTQYNKELLKMTNNPAYVKDIAHQASIKVDEEGAFAETATTHIKEDKRRYEEYKKPIIFKADRPFVFMINNGLFIGAYTKGIMFQ